MKKYYGLLVILMSIVISTATFSQHLSTYAIPSYNVKVIGVAHFMENYNGPRTGPVDERRNVNIQVKSTNGKEVCNARIWVYSFDQNTIMGPYDPKFNELLTVQIDDREWGVVIEAEEQMFADVWISDDEFSTPGSR